jgi:hypothetical protein
MTPLDIARIEAEIGWLLSEYPELAEDETLRRDMIEGSTDALNILSRIETRRQEADAMWRAIADRISELMARQARFTRQSDAMRRLAHRIMDAAQLRKVQLPEATLSVRSVPPKVDVYDPDALPESAWRIRREIDKTKVKELLNEGPVAGARLTNGSETLSIRTT